MDKRLIPFFGGRTCLPCEIADQSVMQVSIKLGANKNKLVLDTNNMQEEPISVSNCIIGGTHILGTSLKLSKSEKEVPDFKALRRGKGQRITGKLMLVDIATITNNVDLSKRLWNHYMKKYNLIANQYERLEKDFQDRMELMEKSYKDQIRVLRKENNKLSIQQIVQPIRTSNQISSILMSVGIESQIEEGTKISPEVRKILEKYNNAFKGRALKDQEEEGEMGGLSEPEGMIEEEDLLEEEEF